MEYFIDDGNSKKIIIRLDFGEPVLESITEILQREKVHSGVVVSGIGTLSQARLHMVTTTGYPPKEVYPEWKDTPLELCSIDGIIANGAPHLHAVIADSKQVYAGHLENGCITLYLCEVVVEVFSGTRLTRDLDDKNILILKEEK